MIQYKIEEVSHRGVITYKVYTAVRRYGIFCKWIPKGTYPNLTDARKVILQMSDENLLVKTHSYYDEAGNEELLY